MKIILNAFALHPEIASKHQDQIAAIMRAHRRSERPAPAQDRYVSPGKRHKNMHRTNVTTARRDYLRQHWDEEAPTLEQMIALAKTLGCVPNTVRKDLVAMGYAVPVRPPFKRA
jgi:hypothetical protein